MRLNRHPSSISLPRTVLALGMVSLFMDISSEMIHSLLPIFLVSVLGASVLTVGIIEGVAESTVMISKLFSGFLSDRLNKRKILIILGYSLGTATKPLFATAGTVKMVFTARFLDRLGKGIRGAPRDALIADVAPAKSRGAAFGLRQSLDTLGALLGPLIAMTLMLITAGNFRLIFWLAVIPGIIAVFIILFFVRETGKSPEKTPKLNLHFKMLQILNKSYWLVAIFGGLFTLSRFSEAFLLLRAENIGIPVSYIPLMMALMNTTYTLSAYPAGRLSDQLGRYGLLATSLIILISADLVLAAAESIWHIITGMALWGLHLGFSQGLLASLVADTAPARLRGTAFGVFNLICGIALLLASLLAGWLWDSFGPSTTFAAGAIFATAALFIFPVIHQHLKSFENYSRN